MLLDAVKTILITTIIQIAAVFGLFFGLGFIHSIVYRLTSRYFSRVFGWTGMIVTGVIGTPIHEFSHWLMAKIFRHHIHSVSWFNPDRTSGKLGHVEHSYDRRSIYQTMGNFFIGASPIIFSSPLLVLLVYIFLPDPESIVYPLTEFPRSFFEFTYMWQQSFLAAWAQIDSGSWKFWVFIFLSLSIALHMAPSSYDQKTMWKGFFHIALLMCIVNIMLTFAGIPYTKFLLSQLPLLYTIAWVLVYAIFISTLFLIISFVLYLIKNSITRRP